MYGRCVVPPPPAGWTQSFSGDLVVYEAPRGGNRIRCYLRAPLESLSRAIERLAGPPATWTVEEVKALVTVEGEYGGLARVAMREQKRARAIGMVFGDVDAIVLDADADHEATLRSLMLAWRFARGTRPRRYLYRPPPGWTPMPVGLLTAWLAPGFPDEQSQLVVYPAMPTQHDPREELAQLLEIDRTSGRSIGEIKEAAFATPDGVAGYHWSISIQSKRGDLVRDLICVRRAPYRYAIKLESIGARHLDVLHATARSMRPIPPPGHEWFGAPAQVSLGAVEHWAE